MIIVEAYRASIGSFCSKTQRHAHLLKVSVLYDTSHEDSTFNSAHDDNANQASFVKTFSAFLFVAVYIFECIFCCI